MQPCDEVIGHLSSCGWGGFAEYVCARDTAPALKPASITFQQAAAIPQAGLLALQGLRDKGRIQAGRRVLINGAGSGAGTFAVQLAKYFGADVTAVCSSAKLEWMKSLGADKVIDYTKEDFSKNGESYDVIFETVGKSSFSRGIKSLKKNGRYLLANPGLSQTLRGLWTSMTGRKKVVIALASYRAEDLLFLKELIEAGKIKSVIDRRYPLEETDEAHRYVEKGHKKGNVVISLEPSNAC